MSYKTRDFSIHLLNYERSNDFHEILNTMDKEDFLLLEQGVTISPGGTPCLSMRGVHVNIWGLGFYKTIIFGVCEE